jgi:hypothetical protein
VAAHLGALRAPARRSLTEQSTATGLPVLKVAAAVAGIRDRFGKLSDRNTPAEGA